MYEKLIAGVGFFMGLAGLGLGVSACREARKMANRVGVSVEALSRMEDIEIREAVIEDAVQKAVDREAAKAIAAAVNTVVNDTRKEIRKDVADGVKQVYPELKSALIKELTRQIGDIDISEIRDEALEKAKETAAEKLNSSMDGILDKFNEDLRNVSKIYNSISSMMGGDRSKEMTLRIG